MDSTQMSEEEQTLHDWGIKPATLAPASEDNRTEEEKNAHTAWGIGGKRRSRRSSKKRKASKKAKKSRRRKSSRKGRK